MSTPQNGHTSDTITYKSSTTQQANHSDALTDTAVLHKLNELNKQIVAECDKYPRQDTKTKQLLFVELELLRLDYIERTDIYALYMDYNKRLHAMKSDKSAYDKLCSDNSTFTRIITEFDDNRKLLYLKPQHYSSNKLVETLRLCLILTYSVGALIPLAMMLPLKYIIPKQNNLAFDDHLSKLFAHGLLFLAGVDVTYEGLENLYVGSNIGMCAI